MMKKYQKHGHTGTSTYNIWHAMKSRCFNPNNSKYPDYGGRGITVCERWLDFRNFLADMGERPVGLSIHRIDNDGSYTPGNCKWATAKEQAQVRRKNPLCKRGHLLTKLGGCMVCQRERNKEFMRKIRENDPNRWR